MSLLDDQEHKTTMKTVVTLGAHEPLLPKIQNYYPPLAISATSLVLDKEDIEYINREIDSIKQFMRDNDKKISPQNMKGLKDYVNMRYAQLEIIERKTGARTDKLYISDKKPDTSPVTPNPKVRSWLERLLRK